MYFRIFLWPFTFLLCKMSVKVLCSYFHWGGHLFHIDLEKLLEILTLCVLSIIWISQLYNLSSNYSGPFFFWQTESSSSIKQKLLPIFFLSDFSLILTLYWVAFLTLIFFLSLIWILHSLFPLKFILVESRSKSPSWLTGWSFQRALKNMFNNHSFFSNSKHPSL